MARLTNIRRKDLSPKDFELYPIWTWDDVREGLHPTDEFASISDEDDTLFIKSKFKAADGTEFQGYLIGYESYYAFAVFIGEEEVTFNVSLPEMARESVEEIKELIGKPDLQLFPLAYESNIRGEDGKPIKGVFDISFTLP